MSGSSDSTIRMRGSSAYFISQDAQDVKPLLVEEEADVEMPYPTAAAVLADSLSSSSLFFKDPFYENDSSVIAAFTFDYDRLERGLARIERIRFTSLLVLLILLLISLFIPEVAVQIFMFASFSFLSLLFIALYFSDHSKQQRRRCLHLAVTERGIYLDEVHEPGSRAVMRRLVYKYAEISRCEVTRTDCCGNVTFQVVAFNKRGWPMLQIEGLIGAQRFVDQVNEMIERAPKVPLDNADSLDAPKQPPTLPRMIERI